MPGTVQSVLPTCLLSSSPQIHNYQALSPHFTDNTVKAQRKHKDLSNINKKKQRQKCNQVWFSLLLDACTEQSPTSCAFPTNSNFLASAQVTASSSPSLFPKHFHHILSDRTFISAVLVRSCGMNAPPHGRSPYLLDTGGSQKYGSCPA